MSLLTVGQLNRYVRCLVEGDELLSDLMVSGELIDFHRHFKTGHLYFTLKDEDASVKCVMFSSSASKLNFNPEDGMSVVLRGRASVYERGGQYQVYADELSLDGAGAARLALLQLFNKLEKEGIFALENKLTFPAYPERVAVISSASGAAVYDVKAVMGRRWPIAQIKLYAVGVQGDKAAEQMAEVVASLTYDDADVAILTRGGGSAEDLSVFNNEKLVRAVAACKIPLIAAIGHEVDVTLCELAATARASTPSAAAELVVPDIESVYSNIKSLEQSLNRGYTRFIQMLSLRYELSISSTVMQDPFTLLSIKETRLLTTYETFTRTIKQKVKQSENEFMSLVLALDALSPLKTLSRGFCVAKIEGKTVKSTKQLNSGDRVELQFQDGESACQVI